MRMGKTLFGLALLGLVGLILCRAGTLPTGPPKQSTSPRGRQARPSVPLPSTQAPWLPDSGVSTLRLTAKIALVTGWRDGTARVYRTEDGGRRWSIVACRQGVPRQAPTLRRDRFGVYLCWRARGGQRAQVFSGDQGRTWYVSYP